MTHEDLEQVYEALARAIDEVGPDKSELYLAKTVLALADSFGAAEDVLKVIEECREGIVHSR